MKEFVLNVECFCLKDTLECGQCFRWQALDPEKNEYIGIIKDRVLKIKQEGNKLYIKSNVEENLEETVRHYFSLDENYVEIENRICKIDENIKNALENTSGLRLLKQDFFETLISYIISANNNIPRIKGSVQKIAERYGKKVIFEEEEYYLFPTPKELEKVTQKEFRECGVGFRDAYLVQTVQDILSHKIEEEEIKKLSTEELRKKLLTLKGVGQKVADCIMLFSCDRKEVFPIDVWVERVMAILYFRINDGKVKKKDISDYANTMFQQDAGIVQQHLFYNMREKKVLI